MRRGVLLFVKKIYYPVLVFNGAVYVGYEIISADFLVEKNTRSGYTNLLICHARSTNSTKNTIRNRNLLGGLLSYMLDTGRL